MQAGVGLLVMGVMPIYMIMPRYSHNYALFYQLLDSNLFTHRNTYAIFIIFAFKSTLFASLLFASISKIPKIYLSYHTIFIRSHFRKLPRRDWQPLYRVGCTVLDCLCRYEGLVRSLLLDWYLGSQKLREILTLLCCITLSSSTENQHMLKR